MKRRRFLAAAGATVALPSHAQVQKPSDKLSIAAIGMGGQIQGHVGKLLKLGHHLAAFCDVDENQIRNSQKRHGDPVAKIHTYKDYRVLFEKEKGIDAVVIATPDHWHMPICRAAMAAGKHIYCEKPLTHSLAEARELREASRASKLITQTGNQGSASPNLRRSMELIAAGVFGDITDIHVWHPVHAPPYGTARPEDADPIPEGLDWDFWCGPAPARPFKAEIYHPAKWRAWYDFGNGTLGDFCCHSFNMPVRALDLDYPEKISVSARKMDQETFPEACTVIYHFAAKGKRGPMKLHFYTGGDVPPESSTKELSATFGGLPRVGCLLEGTKGQLQSGLWNSQCYVRLNDDAKFLGADNHEAEKAIPESIPRSIGHMEEWISACGGEGTCFADFNFGGHLTEIGLAGVVALRMQKEIPWDGPNMKVPGMPEADRFIRTEDRKTYL
ncbi:MAG: putative dehydrogenase [Verrucomicrobiales bacterium]|jgi:predicted dehydrogenase